MQKTELKGTDSYVASLANQYKKNIADFGYRLEVIDNKFYFVKLSTGEKFEAIIYDLKENILGLSCLVGHKAYQEMLKVHFSRDYFDLALGVSSQTVPYRRSEIRAKEVVTLEKALVKNDKLYNFSISTSPSLISVNIRITDEEKTIYNRILNINYGTKRIEYYNNIIDRDKVRFNGVVSVNFSSPLSAVCEVKRSDSQDKPPFNIVGRSFEEVVYDICSTVEIDAMFGCIRYNLTDVHAKAFPSLGKGIEDRINALYSFSYKNKEAETNMQQLITNVTSKDMIDLGEVGYAGCVLYKIKKLEEFEDLCHKYRNKIADFGYGVAIEGENIYVVDLKTNGRVKTDLDWPYTLHYFKIDCELEGKEICMGLKDTSFSMNTSNKEGYSQEEGVFERQKPEDERETDITLEQETNGYRYQATIKRKPSFSIIRLDINNEDGMEHGRILSITNSTTSPEVKEIWYSNYIEYRRKSKASRQTSAPNQHGDVRISLSLTTPALVNCSSTKGKSVQTSVKQKERNLNNFDILEILSSVCAVEEIRNFIDVVSGLLISSYPSYEATIKAFVEYCHDPRYSSHELVLLMGSLVDSANCEGLIPLEAVFPNSVKKNIPS